MLAGSPMPPFPAYDATESRSKWVKLGGCWGVGGGFSVGVQHERCFSLVPADWAGRHAGWVGCHWCLSGAGGVSGSDRRPSRRCADFTGLVLTGSGRSSPGQATLMCPGRPVHGHRQERAPVTIHPSVPAPGPCRGHRGAGGWVVRVGVRPQVGGPCSWIGTRWRRCGRRCRGRGR